MASVALYRCRSIAYIFAIACVCFANKYKVFTIPHADAARFMQCYFNDMMGCAGFLLAVGVVVTFARPVRVRLYQVLLFTLANGLFWEYVTPLYRTDTTTDVLDLAAYLFGSLIYWYVLGGRKLQLLNREGAETE